jgi:protein TonB
MSVEFLNQKNWDNVTDAGRNNLVFQNRNHEYGAYTIRRDYNHHLFLALFISLGAFLSAFIIPKIILSSASPIEVKIPILEQVEIPVIITPPPTTEIKKIVPQVIPAVKPTKNIATQNNTTPIVVDKKTDDNLAVNQTIINPSTKTTTGDVGIKGEDKPIIDDGIGKETTPPAILISAEVMPEFMGGNGALFKYLQQNINYPYSAKENGIKGTVIVGFVIDVTGKPVMLSILKGIRGGKDLEAEAMRVVANMPPWSIGLQNGKPVAVQFSLPVKFDLR